MIKLFRISMFQSTRNLICQRFPEYRSAHTTSKSLIHLHERSLLRLEGEEVSDFLQGLITNDMRHLKEGATSIYSVFLNIKSRVLYDTIIYKSERENMFYVECDTAIINNLSKHLKMYKLRRKVDIHSMDDKMKVWIVYDENSASQNIDEFRVKSKSIGRIFPCGSNDSKASKLVENICIYTDPRISELGLRILTESNVSHNEIIKHLNFPDSNFILSKNISDYRAFRYKLGVAEGVQDLPPGVTFPLEINCDYLHGVSFHKGCYIGQELTARTHHTGVVRKRIMPLILDGNENQQFDTDEKIINENEKIVGKIRNQEGKFVIGLIRIIEALASKKLTVKNCTLKLVKPQWWPMESQKVEATLKSDKKWNPLLANQKNQLKNHL
ncbi:putative transferase CAF17 homolog, mitochondrial [Phymastichus coffea]|uniref:putative transferase CAF17 homolog, mitochondrial n=1 Tax=Phymastichus coffea TaxID=108790 RepID=UPI00273CA34E|nr:putative transferase CAF17 homolog, mitochondrial [Phymastichus coffea]